MFSQTAVLKFKTEFTEILQIHDILQMVNTTIPKNCVEVKHTFPYALDGEYGLHIGTNDDPLVLIYCHGMNTNSPSEYLTLPTGECNLQYYM